MPILHCLALPGDYAGDSCPLQLPRMLSEEWVQPTELVGGNNSDEVLNDLLGREIAESLKQAVEAILDVGVGELGEYVRPDDVTNFAATVSFNSDVRDFPPS